MGLSRIPVFQLKKKNELVASYYFQVWFVKSGLSESSENSNLIIHACLEIGIMAGLSITWIFPLYGILKTSRFVQKKKLHEFMNALELETFLLLSNLTKTFWLCDFRKLKKKSQSSQVTGVKERFSHCPKCPTFWGSFSKTCDVRQLLNVRHGSAGMRYDL